MSRTCSSGTTEACSVVEQPQPKKEVVVQPMKQDIFFALNSAKIQDDQKSKIDMLVEYLQNNPLQRLK